MTNPDFHDPNYSASNSPWRDTDAPVDHIARGKLKKSQDAINKIFKKKYWFEERDEREAEKNGK